MPRVGAMTGTFRMFVSRHDAATSGAGRNDRRWPALVGKGATGPNWVVTLTRALVRGLSWFFFIVLIGLWTSSTFAAPANGGGATLPTSPGQWSAARAWSWYYREPWLVGSNYIPSDADNELQMWQAATFNPSRINTELGWAQKLGMNTMRVFLQNLLWQQNPSGFIHRINVFLSIASKHHIKPIFVLFDSDWNPDPHLGPQPPPIPGVHNSEWVQAPGAAMLEDTSDYSQLEAYVKGVVGAFAHDNRVLMWDVWNEPDNPGGGDYAAEEPKNKYQLIEHLLPKVFQWVRDEHPIQPLTAGLWHGPSWARSDISQLDSIERIELANSDVITFHNYGFPERFLTRVKQLETYGRPVICTEYMARGNGSMIDTVLPIGKLMDVGMVNWGFVSGATQTKYPWNSWQRPYTTTFKPMMWFHDLLHLDGKPYRKREAVIIHSLATSPRGVVPLVALTPVWPVVESPKHGGSVVRQAKSDTRTDSKP